MDHAGFSPNGDGKQDTAKVTITACDDWRLVASGDGIAGEKVVMHGNGNFTQNSWNGTTEDGTHLNGDYTLTLDANNPGPKHSVPVHIKAYQLRAPGNTAFSPNGDQTKDTIDLKVTTAPGSGWIMSVQGQSGAFPVDSISGSSNTKTVTWVGSADNAAPAPQGNGIVLPEGEYTLRLTPQGLQANNSDPTANIVIDVTGPEISNVEILHSKSTKSTVKNKLEYTVFTGFKVSDTNLSNIDPKSVSVNIDGANISSEILKYDKNTGVGGYQARVTVAKNTKNITISIKASDKLGNKSDNKDTYSLATQSVKLGGGGGQIGFDFAIAAEELFIQYGLRALITRLGPTVYVLAFRAGFAVQEILSDAQLTNTTGKVSNFETIGGYSGVLRDFNKIVAAVGTSPSAITVEQITYKGVAGELRRFKIPGVANVIGRSFSKGLGGNPGDPTLEIQWESDIFDILNKIGLVTQESTKIRYIQD